MEENENIMFDEMPDMFGKMFSGGESQSGYTSPTVNKTYDSLYEELCDKCFPGRYMEPYDANLVSVATKLYGEVLRSKENADLQNDLRHRAYDELGVKFDGSCLYKYLMGYLNPRLYLEPFMPDKLEYANKYYPAIEANRDDYIKLEAIQEKVKPFIEKINEEKKAEREKEEKALMNEEQLAMRRFEEDKQWLDDVRNSLGEENWRRYVEEEYGGYIKL